jgi:hypothetical protein
MKACFVTIAAVIISLNAAAYNTGKDPENYCVKSVKGKMVLEHNGKVVKKEINFKDGSCVKPDGTVVLNDGKMLSLKEGECVNETSVLNLSKHRDDNWYKKRPSRFEEREPHKLNGELDK